MSDAPARLEEIRAEARAAIAAAGDAAELEELRVRYLGRKAELTTMLRSIGDLPPEQRGAVGKGGNEVKRALEAQLDERTGALAGAELDAQLARRRDRRDPPRRSAAAQRAPAPDHRRPGARSRTCSWASGSPSPRGRRSSTTTTTSRR